jgi:uncharacterized transporter YbjL
MNKLKEFAKHLLFGAVVGIILDTLGFLIISFVVCEWVEVDWQIIRGVFIGSVTLVGLVGATEFFEESLQPKP